MGPTANDDSLEGKYIALASDQTEARQYLFWVTGWEATILATLD